MIRETADPAASANPTRPARILACLLAGALGCAFAASFLGCNQGVSDSRHDVARDTLDDPALDSLVFWPPTLRYARAGDTLSIRMTGLRLGYTCGEIDDLRWNWRDSTGRDFYTLTSRIIIPGGPSCEPGGTFDSTFRVIFYSPAGERLYLRRAGTLKTDSVLFLSGFGYTESFMHHDSAADTASIQRGSYRFTFQDSTAARPARRVTAVLPVCETFQSALYKREGDAIVVRVRRLVANPLPASIFPPCAGEHADTLEVVRDLYGSF